MSENLAMCAHLKVEYRPDEHADGTKSDRWRCLSCGGDFWPQHWLFPAPWLRAAAAPSLHKETRYDNLRIVAEQYEEQINEIQQICLDAGLEPESDAKTIVEAVRKLAERAALHKEGAGGWISVKTSLPALDQDFKDAGISETVEMWDDAENIWIGSYNAKENRWWVCQGYEDDAPLDEMYAVTHWRLIVGPMSCKCKPVMIEAGDATWGDTDTTQCPIHGAARPAEAGKPEGRAT